MFVRRDVYIKGREGSEIQEEAWVKAIVNGGPAAFQPFVKEYGPYIYRTVFGVLRSPHDAEDVTQEALLQIYRSLPTYRQDGLKAWITRIAVNKAIDYKRYKARRPERAEANAEALEERNAQSERAAPGASPDERLLEREQSARVRERVGELPDSYREVIRAYYMEDKSYEQIAAETGLERKSVESRLYRARNWIKRNWRREDFE